MLDRLPVALDGVDVVDPPVEPVVDEALPAGLVRGGRRLRPRPDPDRGREYDEEYEQSADRHEWERGPSRGGLRSSLPHRVDAGVIPM